MAAVEVQTAPVPLPATPPTLPRKRRRRVPASGASDDCFACRKRNQKCDRKRPYCSQCLEIGKDCSGYRTTLTWGVGVASRGKLRGQSLPIARKSPPAPTSNPTAKTTRTNSADAASAKCPQSVRAQARSVTRSPTSAPEQPLVDTHRPSLQHGAPAAPAASPPSLQLGWQIPGSEVYMGMPMPEPAAKKPLAHGLHRLITTRGLYDDPAHSHSASSIGSACSSYGDSAYASPLEFPSTPEFIPFNDPTSAYTNSPVNSVLSNDDLAFYGSLGSPSVSARDDISSIGSSDHSLLDPLDGSFPQPMFSLNNGAIEFLSPDSLIAPQSLEQSPQQFIVDSKEGLMIASDPMAQPSVIQWNNATPFGLAPRIQYLVDYYDKAVCPLMVAFDGPNNPYRVHVLNLIMSNPALQNAVAALSLNNIRKRSSNGNINDPFNFMPGSAAIDGPTDEEIHYKDMSVKLLDAQLMDPRIASDDSVLVTLLILCLFHVSDSGISKFRTQLAGVQKLLSYRQNGERSEVLDWVQMYFAWFDIMTATVNDREIQIDGSFLDLNNLSADLGNFEEFTGCDGRLFKLIARLSRLNLLSQNRPVKKIPDLNGFSSLQQPVNGTMTPQKDFYSLDGNGWGTPLSSKPDAPTPVPSDDRHDFWIEWRHVRERLENWERDQCASPNMCSASTPTVQRDMYHLSESFRNAALLYTERLAYPSLPSTSLKFQKLVAQGLYHISEIEMNSCVTKFLLWPLFILGTECTTESHRSMIREKCIEIQCQSGFHNNVLCVEILDKVWQEQGNASPVPLPGCAGQQFRWRNAMKRTDGEYILI